MGALSPNPGPFAREARPPWGRKNGAGSDGRFPGRRCSQKNGEGRLSSRASRPCPNILAGFSSFTPPSAVGHGQKGYGGLGERHAAYRTNLVLSRRGWLELHRTFPGRRPQRRPHRRPYHHHTYPFSLNICIWSEKGHRDAIAISPFSLSFLQA